MKVDELLNESTTGEKIISNIAHELYLKIKQLIESGNTPTESIGGQEFPHSGEIGKLRDLVNTKTLGKLYNRLGQVTIEITADTVSGNDGTYSYTNKPVITIEVGKLANHHKDAGMSSVIAHELKHALDDSVTKGIRNRGTSKPAHLTRSHKATTKQDVYLDKEIEINARFTQAAMDMKAQIDKYGGDTISNAVLMSDIILPTLHKWDLSKIFKTTSDNPMRGLYTMFGRDVHGVQSVHPMDNKYFRKLLSRMYKYANE